MAVAHLSVVASRSPALHSWDPQHSAGCRQRRMVHTTWDRDAQYFDPLWAMQGPPGSWLLSQAVSAAITTRFNNLSKATYSQLNDYIDEIWKSLLMYLVSYSFWDCLTKRNIPRMLHFSSITYHPFDLYKTLFPHPPKCPLSLISPHCLVFICAHAHMKC